MPPKRTPSPKKAAPKATGKRTASPGRKVTGTAKTANASAVLAAASPTAKKMKSDAAKKEPTPSIVTGLSSHDATSATLQRVGRAFVAKRALGALFSKKLRVNIDASEGDRLAKQTRHERKCREKASAASSAVQSRAEQKRKRQEELCIASFDGEVKEIRRLLSAGVSVHGKDSQGNVALGEAAVNGQCDSIKALITAGADPNAPGAYQRTPLWRAAYNSHREAIVLLLEAGGDPRISAQGDKPVELASGEAKTTLEQWDTSRTDALRANADAARAKAEEEERAAAEARAAELDAAAKDVHAKYKASLARVAHSKCDFERRVVEYDVACHGTDSCDGATAAAPELIAVALDMVKTAEAALNSAEAEHEEVMAAYLDARAAVAAHQSEELGRIVETDADGIPGAVEVPLPKLMDVVWEDRDSRWRTHPGRWPLLVDGTGRAAVFLRYRDTNYVDAMHPQNLKPEPLRKALLGSIRYGKPLVIDLRDVPLLEFVREAFDAIQPGLWADVMSRRIREPAVYTKLIREADGDRYLAREFTQAAAERMFVFFVSTALFIDDDTREHVVLFQTPLDL